MGNFNLLQGNGLRRFPESILAELFASRLTWCMLWVEGKFQEKRNDNANDYLVWGDFAGGSGSNEYSGTANLLKGLLQWLTSY